MTLHDGRSTVCLDRSQSDGRFAGDGSALLHRADSGMGAGLDADAAPVESQQIRQGLFDGELMLGQVRPLGEDGYVHIVDRPVPGLDLLKGLLEHARAAEIADCLLRALLAGRGGDAVLVQLIYGQTQRLAELLQVLGKALAHVGQARGAEQSIDDRVKHYIAVLVSDQPEVVPDLESAEKQRVTGGGVVQIRADPDSPFIRHSHRPIEVQVRREEGRSVHHIRRRPKVPDIRSVGETLPSALNARFSSYLIVD